MNCLNRRLLAFIVDQDEINFASWRQKIGKLISKSSKLQKVDENFYLEFDLNNKSERALAGVEVIGMEPALPFENIDLYDYGPSSWMRMDLPQHTLPTISDFKKAIGPTLSDFDFSPNRVRLCQSLSFKSDEMIIRNYLDIFN